MSLPRIRAKASDARTIARLLRGALRHEVEYVDLEVLPKNAGKYHLEVPLEGRDDVILHAETVGIATTDGQPLRVSPITRPQAATLMLVIEQLDAPSNSSPPSVPVDDASPHDDDEPSIGLSPYAQMGADRSDSTIVDSRPPFSAEDRPPSTRPPSNAPPRRASMSLVGRVVARKYLVDSFLGEGATAVVFKAIHVDLRRPVALKLLRQSTRGNFQFEKRFRAEALAASKLEHAHVTRVLDFGQEPDGTLYLVMELLAGRSLEAVIEADRKIPAEKVVEVGIQACAALGCAHDAGIIHRDVKPENIMLVPHRDEDGKPIEIVKVCDFGLAKLNAPSDEMQEELTTAGMICGSPAYMSPEQIRGEQLDPRSDVHSLGLTLYEALSGELPHSAMTMTELFVKKLTEPPMPLKKALPDVDPLLADVVMRAIQTDPAKRHPNVRVFRTELREVMDNLDVDSEGKNVVDA